MSTDDLSPPHPVTNPASALLLDLRQSGTDPEAIDYDRLPRLAGAHTIISDVRDARGWRVHQHAYLTWYEGQYWAMWSDGPGIPQDGRSPYDHRNKVPRHDQPGTQVSYAVSPDGLTWSDPQALSGPPRIDGFGWIARGFWVREGQLLGLASHFNAPAYPGEGLSLEAFAWDPSTSEWQPHGTVLYDTLNNFPPQKLPNGQYMMTRRDHRKQLSVMIGGVKAFDDWQVRPVAAYDETSQPEEPGWYILPDGKHIVGLLRDNTNSKRLLRFFSADNGESWTPIIRTNFPDARSKFFTMRTSRGTYAMVSNSNPATRDPLTLAISHDGLVFTELFYLIGGRHIDYPHMIEHDGHLLIAFSGAKQTMEVMRVSLDDIEARIEGSQS